MSLMQFNPANNYLQYFWLKYYAIAGAHSVISTNEQKNRGVNRKLNMIIYMQQPAFKIGGKQENAN